MAVSLSTIRSRLELEVKDTSDGAMTDAQKLDLINTALREISHDTDMLAALDGYEHTKNNPKVDVSNNVIRILAAWWEQRALEVKEVHSLQSVQEYIFGAHPSTPQFLFHLIDTDEWHLWPAPNTAVQTTQVNDAAGVAASGIVDITVDALTPFAAKAGIVLINSEKLKYHDTDSVNVKILACSRGIGLTSAAAHSDNDTVKYLPLQLYYKYVHPNLSADTDNIKFPDDFLDIIVTRAAYHFYTIRRRNDNLGAIYERKYYRDLGRYSGRRAKLSGSIMPGFDRTNDFYSHR